MKKEFFSLLIVSVKKKIEELQGLMKNHELLRSGDHYLTIEDSGQEILELSEDLNNLRQNLLRICIALDS